MSLVMAGILGLSGVALGAFGAHALAPSFTPRQKEVWQTAVSYQMLHALAIIGTQGVPLAKASSLWLSRASTCFFTGSLLFSGSLYALVLTGIKFFGPITPLGGLVMMAGWGCVIAAGM